MLGLVLLYWIGKYYYNLAEQHKKSKWGFAILGIATYYAGIFFFGIIIAVLVEIIAPGAWENFNDLLLGLLMVPFGILSTYGLFKFLEKYWKKKALDKVIQPIELETDSRRLQ